MSKKNRHKNPGKIALAHQRHVGKRKAKHGGKKPSRPVPRYEGHRQTSW